MSKEFKIIGGDTETVRGEPICLQFHSPMVGLNDIVWCNAKNSTRKFLKYLDKLSAGEYTIWFHNMSYDAISLFYDRHIIFTNEDFQFNSDGWEVKGVYSNVVFINLVKDDKIVHLLDTGAYFKTSLAKIADLHCPDLPKLKKPSGLGDIVYTADDEIFCEYALRDSVITYIVGKYIISQHNKYNISLSVSAPHFAANVFKHHHIKLDIPLPSKGKIYASLYSYHGGKNNITVPFGWYRKVKLLDIISAYPKAMHELPSFSVRSAYKDMSGTGHPSSLLPRLGVYRVTGIAYPCKWPILYDREFKPIEGDFENVWITGPELNEAILKNECLIKELYGYFYDISMDSAPSPFSSFVDEFYRLKNEADDRGDKINREFYKLVLNSLYGKFIQSKGDKAHLGYYYDLDKCRVSRERIVIAGGLFHPFIATLITGITRANIHSLEHRYSALHTATDGIFTGSRTYIAKAGLGGLKMEAYGDLLLFRNKLYILYGPKGKLKSKIFSDKSIIKYALHGFNGSVFDLEKIYVSGDPTYEFKKVNRLRESLRRGLKVNAFDIRHGELNIEGLDHGKEENDD